MSFCFLDFDRLSGQEIDLLIEQKAPANDKKGWVPAYKYRMVLAHTDTSVGEIDLRIGEQESLYYGGHIGYNVKKNHRGNRYAGKACLLLKPVAQAHGMTRLYITCHPDNIPSKRTIEALGCQFIEVVNLPPHNDMYLRGERQVCVFEWTLGEPPNNNPS